MRELFDRPVKARGILAGIQRDEIAAGHGTGKVIGPGRRDAALLHIEVRIARADIEPEAHPRRGARRHDDTECVVAGIGVGVRVNLRAGLGGSGIPCEGGLGGERAGREQEQWQQDAEQMAERPADIRVVRAKGGGLGINGGFHHRRMRGWSGALTLSEVWIGI